MVILVITDQRKRAVLISISLVRVIGKRSCNNIRKLGKRNGSVILTVTVAVTLMITAIRITTTVKVHDLLSGVGRPLPSRCR